MAAGELALVFVAPERLVTPRFLALAEHAAAVEIPDPPHGPDSGALCARDRAFPGVRESGYAGGERPAMFVSAEAHYSFGKAANERSLEVLRGGGSNLDAVEQGTP